VSQGLWVPHNHECTKVYYKTLSRSLCIRPRKCKTGDAHRCLYLCSLFLQCIPDEAAMSSYWRRLSCPASSPSSRSLLLRASSSSLRRPNTLASLLPQPRPPRPADRLNRHHDRSTRSRQAAELRPNVIDGVRPGGGHAGGGRGDRAGHQHQGRTVLEKKTILPFLPISLVLLALDPIIGR
jgi:hypothetical protein